MTTAPDTGQARPARAALRRSRTLLEPALHTWVRRLPGPVARVAAYHFGWTDAAGRPDSGPAGKALRPALVFTCAEAVGGSPREAVAPAVAVELVHNFSLLHDDILDGDTTRRHRATAWTVFGSPAALLAGDALLAQATRVLAEDRSPRAAAAIGLLADATTRLIEGEQADLSFEERDTVSLAECLAMTERKTAQLLACSCALGALWGGGSAEQTESLRRFGHHLGMAFQLADDLLGIWGDPEVTGKPAGADLTSRKKSLPVVAALASGSPAAAALAAAYRRPGSDDGPEQTARLAGLVERAGGRAWAENAAAEQLALALGALESAAPAERPAAELTALAHLAARRDH
ncbi:polyprenyl synthetase family protein [Streptomyces sp. YIM 98790]|uniref:polyprenyl synthetase family protein n=1 Tax=Streptomyces sp. YIM 98790 TaxID=2689077 RepID=UPI0014079236|nr:polyprenyl synthetase family protein [Streptomyces sp. YIM 98790]